MPLTLQNLSVYLKCNGKDLEVYDVQVEDKTTISCWVASEVGKEFTVHWRAVSTRDVFRVEVYMDGRLMSTTAHLGTGVDGYLDGVLTNPGHIRPFMFTPLRLTDEESPGQTTISDFDKLGLIELRMRRAASWQKASNAPIMTDVAEIGPIHERSKKAGVHAVSLGAAKKVQDGGSVVLLGLSEAPFAVFRFRYRPLDLLRANGIVPPLPAPKPSKRSGVDLPTSGHKRPRTLVGQPHIKTKNEPIGNVKAEHDTSDDDDDVTFLEEQIVMLQNRLSAAKKGKKKPVVKREASPIQVPIQQTDEVIDLT